MYLYLARDMSNKGAPDHVVWARRGPVAVGVRVRGGAVGENEMERELAEMTGSLEQLGGLEKKEEKEEEIGSLVHGSENLFAQVLVARVVFVEGARGF